MQTETKAQHTPGPWKVSDDGQTIGNGHDADVALIIDEPVARICRCAPNPNAVADARLIAAAPALLAALEALTTAVGELLIEEELEFRNGTTLDIARAAIAAAKGA